MVTALARLAIGLQTEPDLGHQFADPRAADLVPHVTQGLAELAQALAGLKQRRLRIGAGIGLDQGTQIVAEGRIRLDQRLASSARTPHPRGVARSPRLQLIEPAPDRATPDP